MEQLELKKIQLEIKQAFTRQANKSRRHPFQEGRIPSPAIPRTATRGGSRRMPGSADIRFSAHSCPPVPIFLRHCYISARAGQNSYSEFFCSGMLPPITTVLSTPSTPPRTPHVHSSLQGSACGKYLSFRITLLIKIQNVRIDPNRMKVPKKKAQSMNSRRKVRLL